MPNSGAYSSVTVGHLSSRDILRIPFPLPPVAEQRRIVAKLDVLLSKVSTTQQRLSRVPGLLKRFRQSVLAAACSGRLTADWRKSLDTLEGWPATTLSQLFSMRNGKSLTTSKRRDGEIPVFGGNGWIGTHDTWNTEGNVVVVGRVGAQCGNVHFTTGRVWVTDNAISLRAKTELVPQFYAMLLTSSNLNQLSGGTGQPYLSQEILGPLETPVVPIMEQHEIVRRVETLLAFADRVDARLKRVQVHLDRLTQSLLAKAFRGELVPTEAELARQEGREYESAGELLRRIQNNRPQTRPAGWKRRDQRDSNVEVNRGDLV